MGDSSFSVSGKATWDPEAAAMIGAPAIRYFYDQRRSTGPYMSNLLLLPAPTASAEATPYTFHQYRGIQLSYPL